MCVVCVLDAVGKKSYVKIKVINLLILVMVHDSISILSIFCPPSHLFNGTPGSESNGFIWQLGEPQFDCGRMV
jgi:hypothetical protein